MSGPVTLVSIALRSGELSLEGTEPVDGRDDVEIELFLEPTRVGALTDGTTSLTCGFGATWFDPDDVILVDISAEYRLVYSGSLTREAASSLASGQALRDAWPYWVQWARLGATQLGLQAPLLPATPPSELLALADVEFS